jgi:hypothetical protein
MQGEKNIRPKILFNKSVISAISGFRRGVNEIVVLLGCYGA